MTNWQNWNTNVTALTEITSAVGTTALTAGFLLTACGVISTSAALIVLPYLIPIVCIGFGILKLAHFFGLAQPGNNKPLGLIEAVMGAYFIGPGAAFIGAAATDFITPATTTLLRFSITGFCIALGIHALGTAAIASIELENIKIAIKKSIADGDRTQEEGDIMLSTAEEFIFLSLARGISWFIIAAGVASFAPVAIAGGLMAIIGTHLYNNRNSLFGCGKRQAVEDDNHDALNGHFEKATPLSFMERSGLYSNFAL